MKLTILTISIFLSSLSSFAGGGSLRFNKMVHNFSVIEENQGSVTYNFTFKNIGNGPIRITNILTSCGCTTSDYTKLAINSGDSGFVKAIFDPKNRPGPFSRTLTVLTTGTPQMYTLTVEGTVGSPDREVLAVFPYSIGNLRFTRNEINFPSVKNDRIDSFYLGIYNPTPTDIVIKNIVTPYAMRNESKNIIIPSKNSTTVLLTYNGALSKRLGTKTDTVFVLTSDDTLKTKVLLVKSNTVQNFEKLTPEQLALAPVFAVASNEATIPEMYIGESMTHTFDVENKGKSELLLKGFYSTCKCMSAKFENDVVKKGGKGKLILTLNVAHMHGEVTQSIIVITNDPKNSEKKFTLKTKVIIPGMEPMKN